MSRFVARGTAGCVYRPHLPCHSAFEVAPGTRTVGKLMLRSTDESDRARVEQMAHRIADAADPTGQYTVKLLGQCTVKPTSDPETMDNVRRCSAFSTAPLYNQLVYLDGGVDVFDYYLPNKDDKLTRPKMVDFLRRLPSLFRSLSDLRARGFAHNDVRLENVLVSEGRPLVLVDFEHAAAIHSDIATFNFETVQVPLSCSPIDRYVAGVLAKRFQVERKHVFAELAAPLNVEEARSVIHTTLSLHPWVAKGILPSLWDKSRNALDPEAIVAVANAVLQETVKRMAKTGTLSMPQTLFDSVDMYMAAIMIMHLLANLLAGGEGLGRPESELKQWCRFVANPNVFKRLSPEKALKAFIEHVLPQWTAEGEYPFNFKAQSLEGGALAGGGGGHAGAASVAEDA